MTVAGWTLALLVLGIALVQRRRLRLVADADHELRSPVTVLALGIEALAGGDGGDRRAAALATEIERLCAGLDDLAAARRGIRRAPLREPVRLDGLVSDSAAGWSLAAARGGRELACDWRAGAAEVEADRGRLAQLFGNLLGNAVEHGRGEIALRAERRGDSVRVELRDEGGTRARVPAVTTEAGPEEVLEDRGRGLAIARRAAAESGGSLVLASDPEGTLAAVELPLHEP